MSARASIVAWCVLGVAVVGCDYEQRVAPVDTGTPTDDDANADASDVAAPLATWQRDIRPVVEAHCLGCHTAGGIAPMPLTTYADTSAWRDKMVEKVNATDSRERMPPWPMDPTCRDVRDARLLSAAEKQAFTNWQTSGYAEGDAGSYVAPVLPEPIALGDPQIELTRPDAYTPSTVVSDDYRCFLMPQKVEVDRWVSAVDVTPDQTAVVHHVLLYVVPGSETGKLQALDDQSPTTPGYPCHGGTGADGEAILSGWVPGMQPVVYPSDAAYYLPKGARFVMQIHYNTANVTSGTAPADATRARLWALTVPKEPKRLVRVRAVADHDLNIAKGAANALEGTTVMSPYSETVIGIIPHMHLRGAHISVSTRAAGSPSDVCLADIPHWDFHWQQTYQYTAADEVKVRIGDHVTIECGYDNSDGASDIHWGEKTTDEMCLAYLVTTTPRFSDDSGTTCDGFAACMAACAPEDARCPLDCLSWSAGGLACVSCGLEPIYGACATAECPVLLYTFGQCLNGCSTPGDKLACALGECRTQLDALHGCMYEPLKDGACNDEAASCGIGPVATP